MILTQHRQECVTLFMINEKDFKTTHPSLGCYYRIPWTRWLK